MGQMIRPAAWVSYLICKRVRYLNYHPRYKCRGYVDPRVSIGSCTLEINWMANLNERMVDDWMKSWMGIYVKSLMVGWFINCMERSEISFNDGRLNKLLDRGLV